MAVDLSIVIPSHFRIDLLQACLKSVTKHAPPGTEILVVDDGSVDRLVENTAYQFPGVACLRIPQQAGFAIAANAGIRAARHPFVQLLNDDTEVTPDWAKAPLACFANPLVAAVAPLVLRWPGLSGMSARIDSAGDRYLIGGIAGKRHHGQLLNQVCLKRCRVFGVSASSAFYRREAVLKVGGFPDVFRAYFEDVDLSFRLNRAGYQILFEPASCILHHVGASHGQPSGRLLEQQSRNEERVFWRNLPIGLLLGTLPLHAAVVAAKAWRRWREGNLRPFLRGRMAVLREIPELMRHRRSLRNLWVHAEQP
ncbi:MAG: glycosyltransferase family 2 protein [Gemmataceae bacterium]